ncbi:HAD domain-containing protein [Paraburkholderia sp. RL17-337-BIB-A]|uniref:HAD domain-containing protein n=1 Tax=Paraburkholderia sp. RL17-337-BIB-A TaxID=3031636 RepID=UPI0038BC840F
MSTIPTPPPVATGGLILYLDYDGVLHPKNVLMRPGKGPYVGSPEGHALFENCELLEKVLLPYPDVRIVLSTSWVRVFKNVAKVSRRLTPELRARVVGATYHRDMDEVLFTQNPRGMQVWSDVLRRKPLDWLALDDDYFDWPAHCVDKLVRTHPILGMSTPVVLADLRAKLALMHGEP